MIKEYLPTDRDVLIVSLSGGLDSALLLYSLCDKISKQNLNNRVCVIHNFENELSNQTVRLIFDYIKSQFEIEMELFLMEFYRDDNGDKTQSNNENYAKLIDKFEGCSGYLFLGVTKSLPEIEPPEINEDQKKDRDPDVNPENIRVGMSYKNFNIYFPLIHLNKHDIAKKYSELGLGELKEMTVSCTTTKNGMPCENCWWCREKFIAFGHY